MPTPLSSSQSLTFPSNCSLRIRISGTTPESGFDPNDQNAPAVPAGQALGLSLQPLTAEIARAVNVPAGTRGLVVTNVDASSDAAEKGIRRGDVILSVNRQAVATTAQVSAAVDAARRAGRTADALPEVLASSGAEVVYAAGPTPLLHAVAAAAEDHGAWSQVALEVPSPCATGLCFGCQVPVVGEAGTPRSARACVDGPVLRGDRVRWADL